MLELPVTLQQLNMADFTLPKHETLETVKQLTVVSECRLDF